METDITKLVEIIILVIIAPFVPLIAARVKAWLDVQLSREQQAAIWEAVKLAVLAAEQAGLSGVDAKRTALRYAEAQLAAQGISVDFERLGVVIEAVVMDEFNRYKIECPDA
jgi:hypothetical protein